MEETKTVGKIADTQSTFMEGNAHMMSLVLACKDTWRPDPKCFSRGNVVEWVLPFAFLGSRERDTSDGILYDFSWRVQHMHVSFFFHGSDFLGVTVSPLKVCITPEMLSGEGFSQFPRVNLEALSDDAREELRTVQLLSCIMQASCDFPSCFIEDVGVDYLQSQGMDEDSLGAHLALFKNWKYDCFTYNDRAIDDCFDMTILHPPFQRFDNSFLDKTQEILTECRSRFSLVKKTYARKFDAKKCDQYFFFFMLLLLTLRLLFVCFTCSNTES